MYADGNNGTWLRQLFVVITMFSVASITAADETIGIWTVNAPDSASVVSGGFDADDWLNVVNAAVGVNEAFTGESILDDGFANSDTGLIFEVQFAGGIVNSAGDDFVLFDARYDDGSYSVTTDFDGHSASLSLDAGDFVFTGESRDYFYGNNASGPFTAGIWGIGFDLSDLGLSDGDSVNSVRFTADNSSTDPIGLGAIKGGIIPEPVVGGPLLLVLVVAGSARQRRKSR